MTFSDILERAKNNDADAFSILYNQTYQKNHYIAFSYMKNEQDSCDVLQDSYIKIYNNLGQFQNDNWNSFISWTGKITANTALNYLKKRKVILFADLEGEREEDSYEYDVVDDSEENQPDLVLERKETVKAIKILLDELNEEQRVCIIMYYLQEMTTTEIAEQIGCSVNTVKSRLGYARKNIQKQEPILRKKGILVSGVSPIILLAYFLRSDMASAHMKKIDRKKSSEILEKVLRSSQIKATGAKYGVAVITKKAITTFLVSLVAVGGLIVGIYVVKGRTEPEKMREPERKYEENEGLSYKKKTSETIEETEPTLVPSRASDKDVGNENVHQKQEKPQKTSKPNKVYSSEKKANPQKTVKPKPIKTAKPKKTSIPRKTSKPKVTKRPKSKQRKAAEEESDNADWDDEYTDWD